MGQVRHLSITTVLEVVYLCLSRPRTHFPNVPMPYMHPTPEPCALDMQSRAMEAPMPDLVAEPTEFPCGTLLITVVGIIHTALAAIKSGEPHLWASSSLFGTGAHGYFIQRRPLHQARGAGIACTAPLTNLRTEFPEM